MKTIYEFKSGYEEGTQFIEVLNGNLDLIIYNSETEKIPRFYYHRFGKISNYLGTEEAKFTLSQYDGKTLYCKSDIDKMLEQMGKEYDSFVVELLNKAQAENIPVKYDA